MSLLLAANVMYSNEAFNLSRTCIKALTYHIIILTCRPYHFAVVPTSIVSSSLIAHYVPSLPVSLPVPSNLPCKFRSPKQLCCFLYLNLLKCTLLIRPVRPVRGAALGESKKTLMLTSTSASRAVRHAINKATRHTRCTPMRASPLLSTPCTAS